MKKIPYKRKFKDGEHNYHLKTIKRVAVAKAVAEVKRIMPKRKLDITDYVLIVVALVSLVFVILTANN